LKKVIAIASAAIMAVAFTVAPVAAGEKVDICKVTPSNDVIPFFSVDLYFGHMISVSANSANAEQDVLGTWSGEDAAGPIAAFIAAGANLPNADCYVSVPAA
jgi:hypothetical protein